MLCTLRTMHIRHGRLAAVVDVAAPIEAVWDLISRFRNWPRWGPTVRAVRADDDEVRPGSTGRVQTPIGAWLPFEITAVVPGHSWHWKVAGISATGHKLTATGDGHTQVEFTVPVWAAAYLPVVWIGLRRLRRVAEAA